MVWTKKANSRNKQMPDLDKFIRGLAGFITAGKKMRMKRKIYKLDKWKFSST
jgi:hypothetical protein